MGKTGARSRPPTQTDLPGEAYRTLFDTAPDAMIIADADGRYVDVNQAACELTGLSRNELLKKTAADLVEADLREQTLERWTQFKNGGETRGAFHLRHASGQIRTVEYRARLNFHGGYSVSILRDTTDRLLEHADLLKIEARYRGLFDSNIIGIVVADFVGGLYECNDRFLEIIGYSRQDLASGRIRWDQITAPEYAEADLAHIREMLERGACTPYQKEFIRPDGSRIAVMIGYARIEPQNKAICFLLDLTESKKVETALQSAIRSRDEFLSVASHELKTPLTTLKLQTQIRSRQIDRNQLEAFSPERLKAMIQNDERQVNRLSRLIDDMLDVSRINTGQLRIELDTVDLSQLAREMIDVHLPEAEARGCAITLRAPEKLHVPCDRFRLAQVIANLLTNAIKYGDGSPIEVRVSSTPDKACIEVQDQGPGIAPEHRERIFGRFERAVSDEGISGLGLGLFIVRQILEAHRGTVHVESAPGQGSVFRVCLPLRPILTS